MRTSEVHNVPGVSRAVYCGGPAAVFVFVLYNTVNQQILAATKFGVFQNKVIWR